VILLAWRPASLSLSSRRRQAHAGAGAQQPHRFWEKSSTLTMQFRIKFLDGSARVIRELFADARNAVGAIELVRNLDWPPRAVTMRVLDVDGREVHSRLKGDSRS
jgi:hypothetical protein